MKTQEILSIVALALLGLCFLCGLAKMAMKKDSDKKNCDKACSMAIFAAVVLLGISQLLTETEKYTGGDSAFKPSPSDTRITLSKNSKPLYCANKGDCCEIQTAQPKDPWLNPYDVLVCKGGIPNMVSSDDGELYTSPDKARAVFSCYDRVKFKEEDKRRFSCVPTPQPPSQ